jgi:hypothetical protein
METPGSGTVSAEAHRSSAAGQPGGNGIVQDHRQSEALYGKENSNHA